MQKLALFLYTETSLHAGTGSTVSAVDLPIQRERTTRHPLVQGSGIKGALRSQLVEGHDKGYAKTLFGPDPDDMRKLRENGQENNTFAGALSVGDARIVLFPVQSLNGVFAYVTAPMVLARLKRDLPVEKLTFSETIKTGEAFVTSNSSVTVSDQLVLEEFSFTTKDFVQDRPKVDTIARWLAEYALPQTPEYAYWREKLLTSLVILSDEDFTEFTINSTEITTRIRIDPAKKTVAAGALWTQESLPSDTLLMSVINVNNSRNGDKKQANELTTWLAGNLPLRVQVGGDETTGQGFVALNWV